MGLSAALLPESPEVRKTPTTRQNQKQQQHTREKPHRRQRGFSAAWTLWCSGTIRDNPPPQQVILNSNLQPCSASLGLCLSTHPCSSSTIRWLIASMSVYLSPHLSQGSLLADSKTKEKNYLATIVPPPYPGSKQNSWGEVGLAGEGSLVNRTVPEEMEAPVLSCPLVVTQGFHLNWLLYGHQDSIKQRQ